MVVRIKVHGDLKAVSTSPPDIPERSVTNVQL
jgi:hypothetical protein